MKSIVLLVRPWTKRAHEVLAREAFGDKKVIRASEFRRPGLHWLMRDVYREMSTGRLTTAILPNGDDTARDVIVRCRYLRNLEPEVASRAVVAAWRTAEAFLERHKPEATLGVDVDYYFYDVLERVGHLRGIPHLGTVGSLMPGYLRLTSRGALLPHREPSGEELDRVQQYLSKDLPRPKFIERYCKQRGLKELYRSSIREVARHGYLHLRRLLDRDPFSFHYNLFRYPHWSAYSGILMEDPSPDIFDGQEQLDALSGDVVYIPLQWYPEATYDYWGYDAELIDGPEVFIAAGKRLAERFQVVYKEHPACVGRRSARFYQRLREVPNALLLDANVPSGEVLRRASCVVGHGTSTSLEAALRRMPLLSIDEPYFGETASTTVIRQLEQLSTVALPSPGKGLDHDLIYQLLASSMPGENLLWSSDAHKRPVWAEVARQIGTHFSDIVSAAKEKQAERQEKSRLLGLGKRSGEAQLEQQRVTSVGRR